MRAKVERASRSESNYVDGIEKNKDCVRIKEG